MTSPPEYGAGSVGPGNEDRDTTGTQATTSNYTTVLAAANSGDEVLLRAGTTYGNLNIPAGVTVKPTVSRSRLVRSISKMDQPLLDSLFLLPVRNGLIASTDGPQQLLTLKSGT